MGRCGMDSHRTDRHSRKRIIQIVGFISDVKDVLLETNG